MKMPNVITVAEAAQRASLSRQAIHDLIDREKDGPFPGAFQIGEPNSPYYIPLGEFETWLKKRAQSPSKGG
jgi:predicted DNA-binding transcriptional regulator AlpA